MTATNTRTQHTLVIGGTGMLRQATVRLAQSSAVVSVIARSPARLAQLVDEVSQQRCHIHPMVLDYRDSTTLAERMAASVADFGPISLAVCWIHSIAPEAPDIVARHLGNGPIVCRYFDVVGSASVNPSHLAVARVSRFQKFSSLAYRRIVLGFIREANSSRWLTNNEISEGVLCAVEQDVEEYIVGTIHPWSGRP